MASVFSTLFDKFTPALTDNRRHAKWGYWLLVKDDGTFPFMSPIDTVIDIAEYLQSSDANKKIYKQLDLDIWYQQKLNKKQMYSQ